VAFVQAKTAEPAGAAPTVAATFDSNVVATNLIVVAFSFDTTAGSVATVADSLLNPYTIIQFAHDLANDEELQMHYAKNITGGACTVTISFTPDANFRRLIIAEYNGVTANPLDQSNKTSGGTTASGVDGTQSAAIIPTVNGTRVVAALNIAQATGPTITAGTDYTERAENPVNGGEVQVEDLTQAVAASITGKWTLSSGGDNYNAIVASFFQTTTVVTVPADNPPIGIAGRGAGW